MRPSIKLALGAGMVVGVTSYMAYVGASAELAVLRHRRRVRGSRRTVGRPIRPRQRPRGGRIAARGRRSVPREFRLAGRDESIEGRLHRSAAGQPGREDRRRCGRAIGSRRSVARRQAADAVCSKYESREPNAKGGS